MIKVGKMAKQVLSSIGKKVATVRYPFVKVRMPENFRGRIKFYPEKCFGCKLCMKDCPSNAIIINKVGDKQFEAEFRLDKCIYCAQCVLSCKKDALEATQEFELAQLTRDKFKSVTQNEKKSAARQKENKEDS